MTSNKVVDDNGSYDNKKKIYKTFGTVLRNNNIVDEESKRLETISNVLDIPIPKSFDGRSVWDNFISTDVASQGSCGNSYLFKYEFY
jgi:hypothetical protein